MSLYFITGNGNKFKEIQSLIPHVERLDIDLPEIQDIDSHNIIRNKLHEAFKHHSGQFIVEDTSLYLECMNGLPGPLIKWFLQTMGNHGLYEICKRFNNYKATAQVMIGYAKSEDDIHFFEGITEGKIVSPRGDKGFGWNPIFIPNGATKTFAEMEIEEKNMYSMRAIAVEKLMKFLNKK